VDDIRVDDAAPGLRDHEASLLRLLEKVSNGTVVEINETGTRLRYAPGVVTGGAGHEHDCGTARAIGYFLEPLVCLALFAKKARRRRTLRRSAAAARVACLLLCRV
jgi:RNA 3'-terminal phosphate cyclase-like protein